jgi:2-polyprenyl-3-methyl-5-hydroxy-6-metoxy-1,4-benzoquinol methylase
MAEQIFLSHRRSDAWYIARLLKFYFREIGMTVFVDNQIDRSKRFPEVLISKIRECSDFILLLTPDVISRVKESIANNTEDHVFEELKTAYDSFIERGTPKLHVIAYNKKATVDFSTLVLPDHYIKYKDAFCHFKELTSRNVSIDKLEEMSDDAILNDVKGLRHHLASKPLLLINREVKSGGYSASSDEEDARLYSQSARSYKYDEPIMKRIEEKLLSRPGFTGKTLAVLDVGCANGKTGVTYFKNSSVYGKVLGIDINAKSIDEACNLKEDNGYDNFYYEHMDVTQKEFSNRLRQFRVNILGKRKFDVIFCYQVLQHVSSRSKVIRVLLDNLSDGGCLIIRGSDDATKMFYNASATEDDNGLIEKIVTMLTTNLPGMADRFYGRKIYSDLKMAGLSDITVHPITCSTGGPDINESWLLGTFGVSFSWRPDAFKPTPQDSEERISELNEYAEKMREMVDRLRRHVNTGWYLETDFLGYGYKNEII